MRASCKNFGEEAVGLTSWRFCDRMCGQPNPETTCYCHCGAKTLYCSSLYFTPSMSALDILKSSRSSKSYHLSCPYCEVGSVCVKMFWLQLSISPDHTTNLMIQASWHSTVNSAGEIRRDVSAKLTWVIQLKKSVIQGCVRGAPLSCLGNTASFSRTSACSHCHLSSWCEILTGKANKRSPVF